MAYPGEKSHVEYLEYVERVANGEETGPQLSKDEWMRKRQKDENLAKATGQPAKKETTTVLTKE